MSVSREIAEGIVSQGVDEEIVYTLTTTPWGSSPATVSIKVYDVTLGYTDVTSTVMPTGSITASGDVLTFPKLKALTARHLYRIEPKFTAGGNVWEPYFEVLAER